MNSFKKVKFLVVAGFVILFATLSIHDDGIPSNLNPSQQEYVDTIHRQWIEQIDNVIVRIEEFTAYRDRETECADFLISEIEILNETSHKICNDPLFYAEPLAEATGEAEKILDQINLAFDKLGVATVEMAVEVNRRRNDEGFTVDLASYEKIASAFEQILPEKPTQFCAPGECLLCKAKRFWFNR